MYQENLISIGRESLKKVHEAKILVVALKDTKLLECLNDVEKKLTGSIEFAESGELTKSKVLLDESLSKLDSAIGD